MNVIDSSAWLEYFANGPNAAVFATALADPTQILVPSVTLFEVFKRVLLQTDQTKAIQATALMQQGKVIELTAALATGAAELSASLNLPMADSIILATTRYHNATLWTQDAHFEGLAGVRYVRKA